MALRDTLARHMRELQVRSTPRELDATVLALMLKHRDDIQASSAEAPARPAPPAPRPAAAPQPTPSITPSAAPFVPRWNLGATAFQPRHPAPSAASRRAPSPPSALDDDDSDEFSPFACAQAPAPEAPKFGAHYAAPGAWDDSAAQAWGDGAGPTWEDAAGAMTPIDVFCAALMQHNDLLYPDEPPETKWERVTSDVETALERCHYDFGQALELLRSAHDAGERVKVMPADVSVAEDSHARICRFFLAGECRRSDCRFSHNVDRSLCRFWLRGQCLNDPCSFLHDYDALCSLASSVDFARAPAAAPAPAPEPARAEDAASAPAARRPLDASQTRWAAAAKSGMATPGAAPRKAGAAPRKAAGAAVPRAACATALPLAPPTLLPTLATGSTVALDMAQVRASHAGVHDSWELTRRLLHARHEALRERLLVAAGGDAGGWGSSAQASDEPGARGWRGKWVGDRLGLCLGVARRCGVRASLSLDERMEAVLDLHGLYVSEAVAACEHWLLALEAEQFRGLAYVCVGAGKHSARARGALATHVRAFLEHWGYPHAEYDGVIACDPCAHYT